MLLYLLLTENKDRGKNITWQELEWYVPALCGGIKYNGRKMIKPSECGNHILAAFYITQTNKGEMF